MKEKTAKRILRKLNKKIIVDPSSLTKNEKKNISIATSTLLTCEKGEK